MSSLLLSDAFMLFLVISSYAIGNYIYSKSKITLLHPVIVCMVLIITFLHVTHIPYERFRAGSSFINFLLGPAVVAIGVVLYEQLEAIKGKVLSMLTAIFTGSVVGVVSVVLIGKALGLDGYLIRTLEPKSVTTPIAMGLCESLGGNPSLTAVVVVICGIIGAVLGPVLLSILGIKSQVAKGLSFGAAAHGLGTAKAMELGAVEGAISGLSIGLMGVMTSLVIPLIHLFID